MACYNVPAEFAKGLFKRAPFKAAHNKKVSSFDQIFLSLVLGSPLCGDVQRRAMSDVPAVFFLENAEKLESRLNYYLHTGLAGEGIYTLLRL